MYFEAVGYAVFIYALWRIVSFVWFIIRSYVLPLFGCVVELKQFGEWAVVSGATDGIGKAYCEELAKRGFNIFLISRNASKLQNVAQYLSETFSVQTKIAVFDFSVDTVYDDLKNMLINLDVGILVNNVGMTGKYGDFYERIDIKSISDATRTNIFGELNLSHIILPGMIDRKRGVVVHISSGLGYYPYGLVSVYPHTKSFVVSFAKALQYESEIIKDLHHQLITPLYVSTEMTGLPATSLCVPSPSTFAKHAVNTIGLTNEACGYWAHEFQILLLKYLPISIVERIMFPRIRHKRLLKRFVVKDD